MSKHKERRKLPPGRPKAESGLEKSEQITIKMNPFEKEIIMANAREAGMKPAVYCREQLVNHTVESRYPDEILSALKQVYGIANNLNQIAHKANAGGYASAAHQSERAIGDVLDFIKYIKNYGR